MNFMSYLNYFVIIFILIAFLWSFINVKTTQSTSVRFFTVGLFVLAMIFSIITPIAFLSMPKPTELEWLDRNVKEAKVLHAEIKEGEAIYLLLAWEDQIRFFVLGWNIDFAQQLQEALAEAERQKYFSDQPPSNQQGQQNANGENNGEDGSEDQSEQGAAGSYYEPGTVIMKNPFKGNQLTDQLIQNQNRGSSDNRFMNGLNQLFDFSLDAPYERKFYAPPQPKRPEKTAPPNNDVYYDQLY